MASGLVRHCLTKTPFAQTRSQPRFVLRLARFADRGDPLTARAERAIRELELDDDEGLWLLDVIQALATPRTGPLPLPIPRVTGTRNKKNAPAVAGELDYDTFMRGRRREIRASEAERNSLAGTHVSVVRAALNRLRWQRCAAPHCATGLFASPLRRGAPPSRANHAPKNRLPHSRILPRQSAPYDRNRCRAVARSVMYLMD